ncbi:helix-turn-helix domain-containing protein [Streptomyces sp. NPDC006704]|uniref:helix-turn-helix domain-containing protein n=1 Tax=Streptomyces sp. NPDC006704 TaxID=3364760 RepID=UPI00369A4D40
MTVLVMQAAEEPVVTQGARHCTNCFGRLSRYNREDMCGSCSRGANLTQAAFPPVPSHVWARQDVRQALEQRDFGRFCRLVRQYGELRQEDMANLTELSQSFLSLLEAGRRRLTNIDRIIALLDGLGVPVDMTGPMLRPLSEGGRLPLREVC